MRTVFLVQRDETYLHVLSPPALLPGAHIGYLRVRPWRGTYADLHRSASIDLQIVRTRRRPRSTKHAGIVAPENGVVVWGKFVVGVEQLNLSGNVHPILPVLRLPNGQEIAAHAVPDQQADLTFAMLLLSTRRSFTRERMICSRCEAARAGNVSQPVEVFVINPDPAAIVAGDCKDSVNSTPPLPFRIPLLLRLVTRGLYAAHRGK